MGSESYKSATRRARRWGVQLDVDELSSFRGFVIEKLLLSLFSLFGTLVFTVLWLACGVHLPRLLSQTNPSGSSPVDHVIKRALILDSEPSRHTPTSLYGRNPTRQKSTNSGLTPFVCLYFLARWSSTCFGWLVGFTFRVYQKDDELAQNLFQ